MLNMNNTLNKHLLAALLVTPLMLGASFAQAEDAAVEAATAPEAAPAEAKPDWELSYNLGLYSDYIFRGVSLTDNSPAVQGGIDLVHSSGFFLGTWLSNLDASVSAGNNIEMDIYGGYGYTFENGFGITLSGLYYGYPEGKKHGLDNGRQFDTFEASIALSYADFTYTYYNALTDYYGASNSKNAYYNEIKYGTALPMGGLKFMTKVGYQDSAGTGYNQGDLAIGLSRDFSLPSAGKPIEGFNAGATYSQLFAKESGGDNNATVTFYIKRSW
jgi:uncharacterized protein (TIGR02001 family)